jgi:hypothetical protein
MSGRFELRKVQPQKKVMTDVPPLAGRPLWLYFKLARAKLYGLQFLMEQVECRAI